MISIEDQLARWLDSHAVSLDTEASHADLLLPKLASHDLFRIALSEHMGGTGEPIRAAIQVVAALAERSLAAAFVFWAQRAVIECFAMSPDKGLVQRLLPSLLDGTLAGAPGLSNAMKHIGGFDQLHSHVEPTQSGVLLNGQVPFATNVRADGFVVALVAANKASGALAVYAVPGNLDGVDRETSLDLMSLRGTNTAAIRLRDVALADGWQIHSDARTFLPKIRAAFLGMQCGLGLGLARASLGAARDAIVPGSILLDELGLLQGAVDKLSQDLSEGFQGPPATVLPRDLLAWRATMVDLAMRAVQLELQAVGARAYVRGVGDGFARRWHEAAFLQILTPTLVQLKTDLARIAQAPSGLVLPRHNSISPC